MVFEREASAKAPAIGAAALCNRVLRVISLVYCSAFDRIGDVPGAIPLGVRSHHIADAEDEAGPPCAVPDQLVRKSAKLRVARAVAAEQHARGAAPDRDAGPQHVATL